MKCLAVLIDALNPIYLDYMPVVRELSERAITGRLREPLGFTPREAYFGGLTPNEVGYTHMFGLHADGTFNPFALSRMFPETARSELDNLQGYLQPSFASLYARTLAIPWKMLPHLNVAERYSPWDPRKRYRSIFDRLTAEKRAWKYIGWPFDQIPDNQLQEKARRAIRTAPDFLFVHLSELDSTGHAHGPQSVEVMNVARRTDDLVGELLQEASGYNQLVFGDHGMLPVTQYLRLDLGNLPSGAVTFVDSTSVRVWGGRETEQIARDYLQTQAGLFEMTPPLLKRYAAERVPNGLVFWAEPGIVLNPNYFGEGKVRGMHGYLPDVFDNESMFAALSLNRSAPLTVQPIDAVKIHDLLSAFLGFAEFPELPAERRPTFSRAEGGDAKARPALDQVMSVVRERLPQITSLHLCGSFGRGEGTVIGDRLINDLDLVYEAPVPVPGNDVSKVSSLLCEMLELPFVDLSLVPSPEPSQYAYDFRYGTQTLFGSRSEITGRPHLSSVEIPKEAFELLLLNRIAGYLSSFCPPYALDPRYRLIQIVKLGIAVSHHLLSERNAYHYSYEICQQRLALLPSAVRQALEICYDWKLAGRELEDGESEAILGSVRSHLRGMKEPQLPEERRSVRATEQLYSRLYRTFVDDREVNCGDIQAWFRVIHPQ